MKLSKDLIYGIIIGILLFASTGSFKEDKAEFKEEKLSYTFESTRELNTAITGYKKDGWTIIDVKTPTIMEYQLHIGK